jgi:histidine triad (HIT) family protein
MEDCPVCRTHRGLTPLAGGVIYEDEHVHVSHAQLWGEETEHYLGHLFVETKRHAPGLADLDDAESQAVGLWVSKAARALSVSEGAEHVYAFVIGDHVPHLHVHVIPRYPGAPRECWGPRVDEWPEAPRGGEVAMAEVTSRLRARLMGA